MSSFAFILLCVQACLIQNVFSQCGCAGSLGLGYGANLATPGVAAPWGLGAGLATASPYGLAGASPYGLAGAASPYGLAGAYGSAGLASPYGLGAGSAYGGSGAGNVAVAGELPVGGATSVAGQVPIIGAVEYAGCVPAAGAVTIQGNCACGCNGAYYY